MEYAKPTIVDIPEPRPFNKLNLVKALLDLPIEYLDCSIDDFVNFTMDKLISENKEDLLCKLVQKEPAMITKYQLSKEVINVALSFDGLQIASIYNQTESIQEIAAKQNPFALYYCKKPSSKLVYEALDKEPKLTQFIPELTSHLPNPEYVSRYEEHMISDNYENYQYIINPSEAINITYISYFSDENLPTEMLRRPMNKNEELIHNFYTNSKPVKNLSDIWIDTYNLNTFEGSDAYKCWVMTMIMTDYEPVRVLPIFGKEYLLKCVNLFMDDRDDFRENYLFYLDKKDLINIFIINPKLLYILHNHQHHGSGDYVSKEYMCEIYNEVVKIRPEAVRYILCQSWLTTYIMQTPKAIIYLPFNFNSKIRELSYNVSNMDKFYHNLIRDVLDNNKDDKNLKYNC